MPFADQEKLNLNNDKYYWEKPTPIEDFQQMDGGRKEDYEHQLNYQMQLPPTVSTPIMQHRLNKHYTSIMSRKMSRSYHMTVTESAPTEFVKQTLARGLETQNAYMVRLPFFRDKNEYVNENDVPVQ